MVLRNRPRRRAVSCRVSFAWHLLCLAAFLQPLEAMPRTKTLEIQLALVILIASVCWMGCGWYGGSSLPNVQPAQPNVVSLQPKDWYIFYGSGMPAHPASDPDGAWSIELPSSQTGGHLNYVETPFAATVPLHSVTVVFEVESNSPQYVVVDPSDHLPATCRLMIEQKTDDMADPNGRWWANSSIYNLGSQDGQILTINIPLTPNLWTNVNGQQSATAFAAALSNIGWVGVTFGGQYFAGHGVAISSGTAKYVLINYSIE